MCVNSTCDVVKRLLLLCANKFFIILSQTATEIKF